MRLRAPSPLLLLLALLAGSPQPAEGQEQPQPPAEVVAPLPALPRPPAFWTPPTGHGAGRGTLGGAGSGGT